MLKVYRAAFWFVIAFAFCVMIPHQWAMQSELDEYRKAICFPPAAHD